MTPIIRKPFYEVKEIVDFLNARVTPKQFMNLKEVVRDYGHQVLVAHYMGHLAKKPNQADVDCLGDLRDKYCIN